MPFRIRQSICLLLPFALMAGRPLAAQTRSAPAYQPLPSPLLTLGAEGDPDLEFQAISAAHRLPNGDLIIADARSPRIRVFGANGRLVRTMGRDGAGPGEFRAIHSIYPAGDTLIVYDWHQRRLTRLGPDGKVLGVQLVEPKASGAVDLAGRLSNGKWLVTTIHAPSWSHGHGAYRDTLRVGVLDAKTAGQVHWMPAEYPGMSLFAYMPSENREQWMVGVLPLGATTIARAVGDTIYIGDTGTPDLQRWRSDGRPLTPLHLPLPPAPDLGPLLDAQRDQELAKPGADRSRAYILAQREVKRVPPRYRDFIVAPTGDIWLRLYETAATASTRYLVASRVGVAKAWLTLPRQSRVISVEPPYVFVEVLNDDDVASVAVIRWATP